MPYDNNVSSDFDDISQNLPLDHENEIHLERVKKKPCFSIGRVVKKLVPGPKGRILLGIILSTLFLVGVALLVTHCTVGLPLAYHYIFQTMNTAIVLPVGKIVIIAGICLLGGTCVGLLGPSVIKISFHGLQKIPQLLQHKAEEEMSLTERNEERERRRHDDPLGVDAPWNDTDLPLS